MVLLIMPLQGLVLFNNWKVINGARVVELHALISGLLLFVEQEHQA